MFYVSPKVFDRVRNDFDVVASQKRQKAADSVLVPCLVRVVTVCKLVPQYIGDMLRG